MNKRNDLSERQQAMLAAIQAYIARRGYAPSLAEIGVAVGVSAKAVLYYNVEALMRKGYIRRDRGIARGIVVLPKATQFQGRVHREEVPA